ncbi:hypothetical protein MUP77_15450, partial [Candidatus Bathyarchaeota archaeon]|nr:hypothetical protein [Candidatus Bathyarchaeota archaeon]
MSLDTKSMEYIRKLFPEIEQIEQTELQMKVASTWIEAWKKSKYRRIEDGIFTVATPQNRLVDHIRAVTKSAIAIADVLKEIHHFDVNRDYLIAGSLLHDVDKLIVFEKTGDKYVRAEIA